MRGFLAAARQRLSEQSLFPGLRRWIASWSRPRGRRLYEPDLAILRLEPRRLLNADYSLLADSLQLDFTDPAAADTLTISRVGDDYSFELSSGVWSGDPAGGISGAGTDALLIDATVANALADGIQVVDNTDLMVVLEAADFSGLAGGLDLVEIDTATSSGGPFAVPELTLTSNAATPLTLPALELDGDFTVTSASSVDDGGSVGGLSVTGDLTITAGVLAADFNGDKTVDSLDYEIWRANYGATDAPGDANGDGATDAADYAAWRNSLGRTVDAASSSIDIGVDIDLQVDGATKLESLAGGEVRVGVLGVSSDSGRTVELGSLSFQTTGDVHVIEDSADGLALDLADFDGDATPDANSADDVTLETTAGDVLLADLNADDLEVEATGDILDNPAAAGGGIVIGDDATLTAGGAIVLGEHLDLQVGDQTTLVSQTAGAIEIGVGTTDRVVQLDRVRFDTAGNVTIKEDSADGFRLNRNGATPAGQAGIIDLTTTVGDLQLDSLLGVDLIVTSAGTVTDAAGAQIVVFGFGQILQSTGITLADDAADALSVTDATFISSGNIEIGLGGLANFLNGVELQGAAVNLEEMSSTKLNGVTADSLVITSAGAITESGAITVTGNAELFAGSSINLATMDVGGSIGLHTTAGDATVVNTVAIDLSASNISGNLDATATTGGISDSGPVQVGGMAQFTTSEAGADILLDQLAVAGMIGLSTVETSLGAGDGDATIVNATGIDFKATTVRGALDATATTGDVTNTGGAVVVDGAGSFTAVVGDITLGQTNSVEFGTLSLDGGVVEVLEAGDTLFQSITADSLALEATGSIEDAAGALIAVAGDASFTASGDITIKTATVANFGSLSASGGSISIVEDSATTLKTIDATSLVIDSAGDLTDMSNIVVNGDADFVSAGAITLADQAGDVLTVTGAASFTASGDIAIGSAGAVNFGAVALDGAAVSLQEDSATSLAGVVADSLEVSAAGAIDDAAATAVTGAAVFETTAAGDITLDLLDVGGTLGLVTSSGAATVTNAGAIEFSATNVAGNLDATATTGGITDAATVTVGGMAQFTSLGAGADILLDQLAVTGMIGLATTESAPSAADADATIVNATGIDFKATNVEGDLAATATTGDITNTGGPVTVDGAASFTASAGNITLGQANGVEVGSLELSGGVVSFTQDGPLEIASITADQLTLQASGDITDAAGAAISVTGGASITSTGGALVLADDAGDSLEVGGLASFTADTSTGGDIDIGPAGLANFGSLSLAGDVATVQEDSTTVLQDVMVNELNLTSEGIGDNSNIVINGDANFVSAGQIELAENPGDVLTVTGHARFTAGGDIELGLGGVANFGTLSLDGDEAEVREGSATEFDTVSVSELVMDSAGAITDVAGASIEVTGNADFDAGAAGASVLANEAGDTLTITSQADFATTGDVTIGPAGAVNFGSLLVAADEATIQEDSATRIDGVDARRFDLSSAGSVTDLSGAVIDIDEDATITAGGVGSLFLGNSAADQFSVGGLASLSAAGAVTVGPAGAANFGSLSLAGTTVEVQEDSSTELVDVTATTLDLDSAGAIADTAGSMIAVVGKAVFTAATDITLGPTGVANFGMLTFNAPGAVAIQEDSSTTLAMDNSAGTLSLESAGAIDDAAATTLSVTGDATITATNAISLADDLNDEIGVVGKTSLAGSSIAVGEAGLFNTGTLNFNAPGAVNIQEDSGTALAMANTAGSLRLKSSGAISDEAAATVDVGGDARFLAADSITLANGAGNQLTVVGNALFDSTGGAAIDVGVDAAGDPSNATVTFGTLSFRSQNGAAGDVRVAEDDAMRVVAGDFDENALTAPTSNLGDEVVLISDDSDGAANATAAGIVLAGPVMATAVRLQSDGAISQEATGGLDAAILQTISGYDYDAFAAGPLAAPVKSAAFAPDVNLTAAANTVEQFSASTANGSVLLETTQALTIAATTVDGRPLSGITIIDNRGAVDAADDSLDLLLELTSTGGDVVQEQVDVLAPMPAPVAIDVDVARATFIVPDGSSIQLLDMEVDESLAGDTLLLNQDAVRSATTNRFYIDNAEVDASRRETELAFEAASGSLDDVSIADQTGVQLGFNAADKNFALSLAGDLIVIAGKSPDSDDAITQAAQVEVGGKAQFHAAGGVAAAMNGDVVLTGLDIAGPIAVTTDGGDATLFNLGAFVFRADIATLVREETASVGGDLFVSTFSSDVTNEAGASITVEGDGAFEAFGDIVLADDASDSLSVAGLADFDANDDITIGPAGAANFGTLSLEGDEAVVQEDSTTDLDRVVVRSLAIDSAGGIFDVTGAVIFTTEDGTFTAVGDITLADVGTDTLTVTTAASFNAGADITIGPAGMANFGTLNLDGDLATVQEDSTTDLDTVSVNTLALTSSVDILDIAGASIVVAGDALFDAGGDITLADNAADTLSVTGMASFVAADDITLGPAGAVNFGTLSLDGDVAVVQEDSTTDLKTVAVNMLTLTSVDDIRDTAGSSVVVMGDAAFFAGEDVVLSDDAGDVLTVDGMAEFTADDDITIGPAGATNFGTLSLDGDVAIVQEDSTTDLKVVSLNNLTLESTGDIVDVMGASVLVSAEASFTAGGDIALADDATDLLAVGGLASFTALDDITIGPAGAANFGTLSLDGDEATVQEDSTTKLDQVSLRVLTLSSTGEISDVTDANIDVTELATFEATTPFEDVILGDESATVQLGAIDVVSAQHVSLQETDGFEIAGVTISGTFFGVSATGSIEQTGPTLVADALALQTPMGGVLLDSIDVEDFAAEAGGAIDIAGKSAALDALLAELADARIAEGDDTGLAPTEVVGDALTTLAVDSLFGVVVLENLGDLTIGLVADPTTGAAGDANGVRSSGGHAFVETIADGGDPGDLTFDGVGATDNQAVRMENDHVFTAVAAGDLTVNTATNTELFASGALGLGDGVVTDVSGYESYDDRDGFDGVQVVLDSVLKEGVLLQVTIPSTDLDAPTTRLVGAGNANTQSVELTLGRDGETNLLVHITWADGVVTSEYLDVSDPVLKDIFTHTYADDFLNDGVTNPNFPDLPTEIVLLNDPRINLYDEGGEQNLNRSITPTGAPTPERIDNFVLATSQTISLPAEVFVQPEVTPLFEEPTILEPLRQDNVFLLQESFEGRRGSASDESVQVEYGPLDEEQFAEGSVEILEGAAEEWEGGAENFVAEIKEEIGDSDRPAGRYVIKAKYSSKAKPEKTLFEKQSTIADPFDGSSLMTERRFEGVAETPPTRGDDAWVAVWADWAKRPAEPLEGSSNPTQDAGPKPDAAQASPQDSLEPAQPAADPELLGAASAAANSAGLPGQSAYAAGVDALMVGSVLLHRRAAGGEGPANRPRDRRP